jgi:hypothetical protein
MSVRDYINRIGQETFMTMDLELTLMTCEMKSIIITNYTLFCTRTTY